MSAWRASQHVTHVTVHDWRSIHASGRNIPVAGDAAGAEHTCCDTGCQVQASCDGSDLAHASLLLLSIPPACFAPLLHVLAPRIL